jgi:hypothetical protein
MRGISWLAENLLDSQEGLCSIELVTVIFRLKLNLFPHLIKYQPYRHTLKLRFYIEVHDQLRPQNLLTSMSLDFIEYWLPPSKKRKDIRGAMYVLFHTIS